MSIQIGRIGRARQFGRHLTIVLVVTVFGLGNIRQPSLAAAGSDTGSGLGIAAQSDSLQESTPVPSEADASQWPALTATQVETNSWPMAGANPQRTSWSPEQVPSAAFLAANRNQINNGRLYAQWAQPIEPYIPQKVQVIAANSLLYISTSRGLYALNPDTGAQVWVYPTELPLGNSPTIDGSVAYVGGLDKKIHAINALTGAGLWTFEATAGFETNPLVVNGILYAGNRDGYFYAVDVNTHQLAWKYPTGGPILYSAAYTVTATYPGGVVYFASNDNSAYALNAQTGDLVWKSAKLPGAGFQSWWPVVYGSVVVFSGAAPYRDVVRPGPSCRCNIDTLDRDAFAALNGSQKGTLIGSRSGEWVDATRITQYFLNNPDRRTYLILNRDTGTEITAYAPILWFGSQSGPRYPPVVGSDGYLYQANDYMYSPIINGGGVSGWKYGTLSISAPSAIWLAIDEPIGYSAGGNIIYWVLSDNAGGAFDITVPNTRFWSGGTPPAMDATREWDYWSYNLSTLLPGYDAAYGGPLFGGINGVYESGGENPFIPYRGKVFSIRANAVVAFGPTDHGPVAARAILPTVAVTPAPGRVDQTFLRQRLATEVQKILDAGHLKPGYINSGLANIQMVHNCGDYFQDYWHDPSDTLYALLRALPYLPADMQQNTKAYLASEFAAYPPYQYDHVGWKDGVGREAFTLPPDVTADMAGFPKTPVASWDFEGWGQGKFSGGTNIPPHVFYVLWKYAQAFPGTAATLFNDSKNQLSAEPGDTILAKYPFVHNSFIAGYVGYLNLQKLAGYTESATIRSKLNRLLALRASGFSKDNTYYPQPSPSSWSYCLVFSISRNFLFLVPELGDYLQANALSKVQEAVDEYTQIEPYWFVAGFEDTLGEGVGQPLYDVNALFQAKALILKEPTTTLVKYLDVPAVQRGDLFYLLNLVQLLDLQNIDLIASRSIAEQWDTIRYTVTIGSPLVPPVPITVTDNWSPGMGYKPGTCTASTGTPNCSASTVTWSGPMPSSGQLVITYDTQVTTGAPTFITNQLQVDGGAQGIFTRTVTLLANPLKVYLPMVVKGQ